MRIELANSKPADVIIYEYGVKLDAECIPALTDQIMAARRLYNDLVACMRGVIDDARTLVLARAGDHAQHLNALIEQCTVRFSEAKARNDEAAMKAAAQERRDHRRELVPLLSETRKRIKADLAPLYARIGKNSACATYQLRSAAVQGGLGWATANAVLDSAMRAWKRCMSGGSRPAFTVGADKLQDSLSLQFTAAGGIASERLLAGEHSELRLSPPKTARDVTGSFAFRLGAAAANTYATGTWTYHRPLPEGSSVGLVRLVSRRRNFTFEHALQFLVKLPAPLAESVPERRKPLACVHFGWALDTDGRRVAAIADGNDPGLARLVTLPEGIERDLERSAEIRARRDEARDQIVVAVKAFDASGLPEALAEELAAIRRLRPEHVAQRRLYRLSYALSDAGVEVPGLTAWRKLDRKQWQAEFGIARRARNRRSEAWRSLARGLVNGYAAVCVEPLDLETAAKKIDEQSGERSEFTAKARRGRVVCGLYELRQLIAWSCTKTRTPLIELTGPTVTTCVHCGDGVPVAVNDSVRDLACPACGAVTDRKLHGAARAHQLVEPEVERLRREFEETSATLWQEAEAARQEKAKKMADGRRKSRESRVEKGGEDAAGQADGE